MVSPVIKRVTTGRPQRRPSPPCHNRPSLTLLACSRPRPTSSRPQSSTGNSVRPRDLMHSPPLVSHRHKTTNRHASLCSHRCMVHELRHPTHLQMHPCTCQTRLVWRLARTGRGGNGTHLSSPLAPACACHSPCRTRLAPYHLPVTSHCCSDTSRRASIPIVGKGTSSSASPGTFRWRPRMSRCSWPLPCCRYT